jgi:asparagine synthase (glutamine-hydrolysing)
VAARTLPKRIANRPKTMFRASRSEAFLDKSRPEWVDQLLSRTSLEATGYFDVDGVLRERARQVRYPRFTPKRIIMDLSLTCVVATQLWHHIYLGGGLCDLPTWSPFRLPQTSTPSLDVVSPIETACSARA